MLFKYKCLIDNTPLGIMIGWVSALVLVVAGYVSPDGFWKDLGPTIIATTGAMLGALLATAAVLSQIEAQHETEEGRRKRRLTAAKAALPYFLSDWSARIEEAIRLLNHIDQTGDRAGLAKLPSEAFVIPQEITFSITENIEAADAGDGKRLANLLRHYQVFLARIQNAEKSEFGEQGLKFRIGECFILRGLVHDCFKFARTDQSPIPTELQTRAFWHSAVFIIQEAYSGELDNYLRELSAEREFELPFEAESDAGTEDA